MENENQSKKYLYNTCCVKSTAELINEMTESASEISLKTFQKHCESRDLLTNMGYNKQFPISKDWHVKFYKSKFDGKKCYYMVHSAIEYIFTEG